MKKILLMTLIISAISTTACKKSSTDDSTSDISEPAQQVGDAMASIDEGGGSSSGSIAMNAAQEEKMIASQMKAFDRLETRKGIDKFNLVADLLIPKSTATSCALGSTFSSCSSNSITRTFNDCTIGTATLSGTVTFTWGGGASSCSMSGVNQTISRSPNFAITGRRGATLTVSKTGTNGQLITKITNSSFSFTNDGIKRVFNGSAASFDFTTSTTSAITISGTSRSGRTLSGGNLRVTNNNSGVYCDFAPSSVTYASTCNCATSGSWSATCSDSKSASVSITGCGTADFTYGETTTSVTFDRCYGI